MANWKARFEAVAMLPDLDPVQEGFALPLGVNVAELRKLYCTTMAPNDGEADERIESLARITDPLRVLTIVAPHVPVKDLNPPPVIEATLAETLGAVLSPEETEAMPRAGESFADADARLVLAGKAPRWNVGP